MTPYFIVASMSNRRVSLNSILFLIIFDVLFDLYLIFFIHFCDYVQDTFVF